MQNLIDETIYNRLSYTLNIRDPGDVRLIGDNGKAFDRKNFNVLRISIGLNLIWHVFSVVFNLLLGPCVNESYSFVLHFRSA